MTRTSRLQRLHSARHLLQRMEQAALQDCQVRLQQAEQARNLLLDALEGVRPAFDPALAAAVGGAGRALRRVAELKGKYDIQSDAVLGEAAAVGLLARLVERVARQQRERMQQQDFAELIDQLTLSPKTRPKQD